MGVGMLRGEGFLGFLVSWFLGCWLLGFKAYWFWFIGFTVCLVYGFQSFLVSWFLSFKVSKIQRSHMTKLPFHIFDRY